MGELRVRPAVPADGPAIAAVLTGSWGETTVVGHGVVRDAGRLPGFVAERDGAVVGVLTYHVGGSDLEVVTVDAVERNAGVGTRLLAAALDLARERGLRRLWLVTTNDNVDALRFYQRRGLRLVAVHPGAADAARRSKPTIPEVGAHGIEIHDELELEMRLQ
jgi:ribosomal protein S18 acetylase RimI-like enzyme